MVSWSSGKENSHRPMQPGLKKNMPQKKSIYLHSERFVNHITTSTALVTTGREWLFNGIKMSINYILINQNEFFSAKYFFVLLNVFNE